MTAEPLPPVMPSSLADVPAWLAHRARKLGMRILFLGHDAPHRHELTAAAADAGLEVIDVPADLTDEALAVFMSDNLRRIEQDAAADARLAGASGTIGRMLGETVNDALAAGRGVTYCPHCGEPLATVNRLVIHLRDTGELPARPLDACPVLWRQRGGTS